MADAQHRLTQAGSPDVALHIRRMGTALGPATVLAADTLACDVVLDVASPADAAAQTLGEPDAGWELAHPDLNAARLQAELATCQSELQEARADAQQKHVALAALRQLCNSAAAQNQAVLQQLDKPRPDGGCSPSAAAVTPDIVVTREGAGFAAPAATAVALAAASCQTPSRTAELDAAECAAGTTPPSASLQLTRATIAQLQGLLASSRQRAANAESDCRRLQAEVARLHERVQSAEHAQQAAEDDLAAAHVSGAQLREQLTAAEVAAAKHVLDTLMPPPSPGARAGSACAPCGHAQGPSAELSDDAGMAADRAQQVIAALRAQLDEQRAAAEDAEAEVQQLQTRLQCQAEEVATLQRTVAKFDSAGTESEALSCGSAKHEGDAQRGDLAAAAERPDDMHAQEHDLLERIAAAQAQHQVCSDNSARAMLLRCTTCAARECSSLQGRRVHSDTVILEVCLQPDVMYKAVG